MELLANIVRGIGEIVQYANSALTVYKYVIIASAIISLVNIDPYNPIVNFIYRITEPLMRRIRRRMPNTGPIDLSPIVAFILIHLAQIIIFDTAYTYLHEWSINLKLSR
jgi:YggT family protein